jgi:hypothetical protein
MTMPIDVTAQIVGLVVNELRDRGLLGGSGVAGQTTTRRPVAQSGIEAGGTGIVEVILGAAPAGGFWLVERLVVITNSVAVTAFRLYAGLIADDAILDLTAAGNLDVADEASPAFVPGGVSLIGRWTGVSALARCTVAAQVVEVR